jgi:putative DNA primase/helicase
MTLSHSNGAPNFSGPAYQTLTAARLLMSQAAPGRPKLLALERGAKMLAMPVRHGFIEKADAVDGLWTEAHAVGLMDDIGEDVVLETIARGLVDFSEPNAPLPGSKYDSIPGESSNSKPSRALVTCNLSDIAPEKIEWLWPGRIAIGKLTLIAGEPGLGKSQVTLRIAAAVTTGDKWPGNENDYAPSGSIIILSAEDGLADTTRPRFDAAGGDPSRVRIVRAIEAKSGRGALQSSFNLASDLALLEAEIIRRGDVRLVIIDPVSSYMGKTDSHKNTDVRGVLEPIGSMAERLRVAVLAITHLSKGDGRAINRFIGSIAFVAAARAAFTVVTDPDDETGLRKLFLQVKNNIAPPAPGLAFRLEQREVGEGIIASAVAWDSSPVTISADEAMGAINSGSHTAKDDALEFLRDALGDGPVDVLEIEAQARNATMLSENKRLKESKPFRDAANTLGVVKKRVGFGPGAKVQWALPDGEKDHRCPLSIIGALPGNRAPMDSEGTYGESGALFEAKAIKAISPETGSLSGLSSSDVALDIPGHLNGGGGL